MAAASFLVSTSLILFTFQSEPIYQLLAACLAALTQNVMYAVFYAYAAEVFPTNIRGKKLLFITRNRDWDG